MFVFPFVSFLEARWLPVLFVRNHPEETQFEQFGQGDASGSYQERTFTLGSVVGIVR